MNDFERKLREFVRKIPGKALNSALGIVVIPFLFACVDFETLKQIEIGCIPDVVNTINNLAPSVVDLFDYRIVKIAVCSLFSFLCILRALKTIMRPKALIISHSSFSNALSTYDKEIVLGYSVKEKNINLVKYMDHNIVDAVREQDYIIKEALNACNPHTEMIYYGIAHTPLIFRAGFQVGDEGRVRLLHKYRNDQSCFREISSEPDTLSVRMDPIKVQSTKTSNEMLVVIATSLPIKDEDLVCFQHSNYCCRLYFQPKESGMYGFDSVVSYATMERLKTDILQEIRENVTSKGVQKVHLVLSTSSDFTFSLAQGFSKNHDPEIVVYHYDRNSDTKYPWGISNIASPANAVVRHSLQAPVD